METLIYLTIGFLGYLGILSAEKEFFHEIDRVLELRLALQAHPQKMITKYCITKKAKSNTFCHLELYRHTSSGWSSPCSSHREKYSGRYYRIILGCKPVPLWKIKTIDFTIKN